MALLVRWPRLCCVVVAVFLIATGCSRKPREVAPEDLPPGKVVDRDPTTKDKAGKVIGEDPTPKDQAGKASDKLTIGPRAVLREPAPDLALGQSLQGSFRSRMAARTHTFQSVRFTPDGLRIVGGGYGPDVLVVDLATGEPSHRLAVLPPEQSSLLGIKRCDLSPDGRTVVTIGPDHGEIWLWDLPSGTVRQRLNLDQPLVRAVFTADSKTLFVLGINNEALRFDAATAQQQAKSAKIDKAGTNHVLATTPDGKTVILGAEDGNVILLDGETLKEKKRLPGHKHGINGLAVSPDGKTLASIAFDDGMLKLWDLEKLSEIRTLKFQRGSSSLTAVAFSPSGKFLAAGGSVVILWEVKTGVEQGFLQGYTYMLNDLAFSPDGTLLAGAPNSQRGIVVWDLGRSLAKRTLPREERARYLAVAPGGTKAILKTEKGAQLRDLETGKDLWNLVSENIYVPTFASDGSLFAFSKADNKVILIDAVSGKEKGALDLGDSERAQALAFRSDTKQLAVATQDSRLQIWDLSGKQPVRLPATAQLRGSIGALVFHPGGKTLAVAAGPTLSLVNVETVKPIWTVVAHEGGSSRIVFSPDGSRLITVGGRGRGQAGRLWNAADGKELAVFSDKEYPLHVFFTADGQTIVTLATKDYRETFFAWDASTGKRLGFLRGSESSTMPLIAPDHKTFLIGHAKKFDLYETSALTREMILDRTNVHRTEYESTPENLYMPLRVLKSQRTYLRFGRFSADGTRLVSIDGDNQLIVWDVATGKTMQSFPLQGFESVSFGLSADGKRLAISCRDDSVRLWNLETAKEDRKLTGHTSTVRCVAFSPDGRWLASGTGGLDTELFLWDASTGAKVKELARKGSMMESLAFTPDNKVLVAGVNEDGVRRFEVESGKELRKLPHTENVKSVAISPDGSLVAGGGGFSSLALNDVTVWDLASEKRLYTLLGAIRNPNAGGNAINIERLAFGPDGLLAVETNTTSLWNARTGKRLQQIPNATVHGLSSDGKTLAVTANNTLALVSVKGLLDDRLQNALAPALRLGAEVKPEGDGLRVELEVGGGPDSIAAFVALEKLTELRSLKISRAEMIPEAAVQALVKLTSLRSLAINFSDITDAHVKMITALPHLTALDLSECGQLTGPGFAVLAKLPGLEELRLNGTKIDCAGLQPLVGLKKLRSLSVPSTLVNNEGLEVLAKFPALTDLNLGSQIDDAGLAKLKDMKLLRSLLLEYADISDAGAAHLSRLVALESLDLSRTKITDAGLAHLKALTNLKNLNLAYTKVTDAGFKHLSSLTKLTSIGLEYMEMLTGTGLEHLRGATGLTEVKLRNTGVTDAGLAGLKDWTHLQALELPDRITDAGLLHLGKLTNLQSINLDSLKELKGPGLAGLKNATALKQIDLSRLPEGDAGLEGIKEWKHLEVLTLPKSTTDAGLARIGGLKALKSLTVQEGGAISNTGLAHLKGLTNLETVDLDGSKISDAGLVNFEGLTKLRLLSIKRTGVTEPAAEKLKKKLPEAFITH